MASGSVVRKIVGYWPNGWVIKIPAATTTTSRANVRLETISVPVKHTTTKDTLGWRDPTPYEFSRSSYDDWRGIFQVWTRITSSVHYLSTYEPYQSGAHVLQLNRVLPKVPINLVHRAEVEALLKLKSLNVNYGVLLAESRKSLGLVGSSIITLTEAYLLAKKGKWKAAAEKLGVEIKRPLEKGFFKRWLALQYGWLPLLSDIHGAVSDSVTSLSRLSPDLSVKRVLKVPYKHPIGPVTNATYGSLLPTETIDKSFYGVKVRLDYSVDNLVLSNLSNVGFLNPWLIAWELVPFSFVVDWLAPVGNWIEALDATQGLTFKGGTCTTFYKLDVVSKCVKRTNLRAVNTIREIDVSSNYQAFGMNRSVYSHSPFPVPYVKSPVSGTHAANAIALLANILLKGH